MTASPAAARLFAWAGAALFAGSLGYFLFAYTARFGDPAAVPSSAAAAFTTNLALFTVFALHHSVFARARVRAWVSRTFSPALERSAYVWIASVMFLGVCALWQPIPGVAWQVRGPLAWLLPLAQLGAVWLTLRSAAIIDVWELAGVRQVGGVAPKPQREGRSSGPTDETEFRTEGPYGWVRHPIYLGWLLLVFPVATMTMTRLSFAVISSAYILIAIPFEERSLRRAAGPAYQEYMRQVPWKLIPHVY